MPRTDRRLTVAALLAALFMAAMEMTVVSTAMPTVVGDLGGIHLYSWVFTAYLLASTVMVPLFGKLADIYGRKPVLLVGLGVFLAGSVASGQARSMVWLIACRTVQGLGAGAVQPVTLTIVGDLFDLEERGRVQGLFGAIWGLAGLAGPLLGGVIVKFLSWRWVFYINVPFGLASAAILTLAYHERVEPRKHPLDLAGAGLLTAAVFALLAGSHGGWARLGLPIAIVLFLFFVRVERTAAEPVLPVDLFADRTLAVSSVLGALAGAGMLATVTYVPLYVQGVLRGSPTDAGSAITPMVVGWPIASALAGRWLARGGFRALVRSGFFLCVVAAALLATFLRPGATLWVPRLATGLFGFGLGFANTALLIAVQMSVPWSRRGVATASTMFFRTIGGTLAVGALGGVLAASLAAAGPSVGVAADELLGPDRGARLDPVVLAQLAGALESGLSLIFHAIAGIAVAAFLGALAFPRVAVRREGEGSGAGSAPDVVAPTSAGVRPLPARRTLPRWRRRSGGGRESDGVPG